MTARKPLMILGLSGALLLWASCGDDEKTTTGTPTIVSSLVGVPCGSDADCGAVNTNACQRSACDLDTGFCAVLPVADGTSCSTGAPCIEGQTCLAGTCGGGAVPAKDCGDRVCGSDTCGNSCGRCADNFECTSAGRCQEIVDPCMGITFDGCCTAAGNPRWCQDGQLVEEDCGGATCGWRQDVGYYFCDAEEDPAPDADLPYLCPGETCPKKPCEGLECGFRCGESCGECDDGVLCTSAGKCERDNCGDLTFTGCCDNNVSVYCDANEVKMQDCAGGSPPTCGWNASEEYYDCAQSGADPSSANPYDCSDLTIPGQGGGGG